MAGIDIVKLREKLMEVQSGIKSQGGKYFVPPYGDTRIRILPGPDECPEEFFVQYYVIRINDQTLISPKSIGQHCPVAAWVNEAYESGNADRIAKAKILKPRKQFAMNVIIRELKDQNGSIIAQNVGPRVYSCGVKVFEKVCTWIADTVNYPNFIDAVEGNDCRIVKVRKDGFPNYDQSAAMAKATPIDQDPAVVKQWIAAMHDLRAEVKVTPAHVLEQMLSQFLSGSNGADLAQQAATSSSAPGQRQAATTPQVVQGPIVEDEEEPANDDQAFFAQLKNITSQ